ncbi:pre-mRNA-splicing factor CWC22 [Perkinsela sp. CCAP 1560/4]|nr:pre-mRNA-splicing factor CWC22 [Perkinsela sp. CCAP 1560/4]|eukprot:KNH07473.1 pre-mRNA-splicing factor CWC22 [Perkinsela sp. CCAP 1560/4]
MIEAPLDGTLMVNRVPSVQEQKERWQAMRRSIHSILNKMNPLTLPKLLPELLGLPLNVYEGIFCKSMLEFIKLTHSTKHQTSRSSGTQTAFVPQPFHCYGIIIAVINTFHQEMTRVIILRCLNKLFGEFHRIFPEAVGAIGMNITSKGASHHRHKSYQTSQTNTVRAYMGFLSLLTSMKVLHGSLQLDLIMRMLSEKFLSCISASDTESRDPNGKSHNSAGIEVILSLVTETIRDLSLFYSENDAKGLHAILNRCRELYQRMQNPQSSMHSVRSAVYMETIFEIFASTKRHDEHGIDIGSVILSPRVYHQLEESQYVHEIDLSAFLDSKSDTPSDSYDPKFHLDFFQPLEDSDLPAMNLACEQWRDGTQKALFETSLGSIMAIESSKLEPISDLPPSSDDEGQVEEVHPTEVQQEEEIDSNLEFDSSNFLYQVQRGEIRKSIVLVISGSNSASEAAHKIIRYMATKGEEDLSERLSGQAIELIACQILIQIIMYHSSLSKGLVGENSSETDLVGDLFRVVQSSGNSATNAFHTKYYHQLVALLCMHSVVTRRIFENYFVYFYENASKLSNTNTKLIAMLYGFLLKKDSISWGVLKVCSLDPNSPHNNVHTRVFLKFLFLDLHEHLDFVDDHAQGEGELSRRLTVEHNRNNFENLFPFVSESVEKCFGTKNRLKDSEEDRKGILMDRAERLRYAVIYFATIGLSSLGLVHRLEEKHGEFLRVLKEEDEKMATETKPGKQPELTGDRENSRFATLNERLKRIRKQPDS